MFPVTEIRHEPWWKTAVVYQIYPSSFCDSNGDGIGDLKGITSKLDYIQRLGVDVVWLSPVYKSPQQDMGYDISDYCDIDPRYGTLEDWDELVQALHERGMKMMMDLVVNHTSDQHPWFVESRSSKTNPKRDWYIWQPAKGFNDRGEPIPPSNLKSAFQGSAWEWDSATEEFYLHLYHMSQPDLNWTNPEVRKAVWEVMEFWLNRKTDGFRMDVINLISKARGLETTSEERASKFYANGPTVHDYLQEMHREVLSQYPHIITVGETPYTTEPKIISDYVLPSRQELNMVFHFELADVDLEGKSRENAFKPRKAPLRDVKEVINKWQSFMSKEGFWNSVYIENHDNPRSVSRFTSEDPKYRAKGAKLLALLQIAQSGTLYVFQGQEIGMVNIPESWDVEEYKDVNTTRYWEKSLRERGEGADMSDVLNGIHKRARDNGRTPMQWDSSPHAGFTSGTPWMRVNDDYTEWNATSEEKASESVLSFWKKAIKTRKLYDVLTLGDFVLLDEPNDQVFSILRVGDNHAAFVTLNFDDEIVHFKFSKEDIAKLDGIVQRAFSTSTSTATGSTVKKASWRLLISNYDESDLSSGFHAPDDLWEQHESLTLRPYEGRIYIINLLEGSPAPARKGFANVGSSKFINEKVRKVFNAITDFGIGALKSLKEFGKNLGGS